MLASKNLLPELEIYQVVKLWFTDLDLYKWLCGAFGAIILWFGNLSFGYLNNRNKAIDDLCRRMEKVEKSLIITRDVLDSDGNFLKTEDVPMGKYVKEMNHKIINHDIAEDGALDLILERLNDLNDEK